MNQGALFTEQHDVETRTGAVLTERGAGAVPVPKARAGAVPLGTVAVPFGRPDRRGLFWYQRFHKDLQELGGEERAVLYEILTAWPGERMEECRLLLNRWCQAQPLERDNWLEAVGE